MTIVLIQLINTTLHAMGTAALARFLHRQKAMRGLLWPVLIFALARLLFFMTFWLQLIANDFIYLPSLRVTMAASFSSTVEALIFAGYGYFLWSIRK